MNKFGLIGISSIALLVAGCTTTEIGVVSGEKIMNDVRSGLGNEISMQEPLGRTLTLEEAVARAIKYNVRQRLGALNEALSHEQHRVAQASMLPSVVASMNYSNRDKYIVSNSKNINTGVVTQGTTTSESKTERTTGLKATWNILDFGLSYVRAKQAADRTLIAMERRRKVTHELVNEVQADFWRAYSAQRLEDRVKKIQVRVDNAKSNLESVLESRLDKPVDVLRDLREILNLQLELKSVSRQLTESKTRLASHMGLMPNARFKLASMNSELPKISVDYKKLENYALQHRPELREDEYNIRISRDEVTASMLGMLPSLTLGLGINQTDDNLVQEQDWIDGSLNVGWNLMNLVSGPRKKALAEAQHEISKARKLVVGSAVLMSVRLAWLDYWESLKSYRAIAGLQDVEDQLVAKIKAQVDANSLGEIDIIRADISNLVSALRHGLAFADVMDSQNRLLLSIAYDPAPRIDDSHDLQEVTQAVAVYMNEWQNRVSNMGNAMATEVPQYAPLSPNLS